MDGLRVRKVVKADREIRITGLPFKKGQMVELTLRPVERKEGKKRALTARALLDSGLPGLWADRNDIADSAAYARRLREEAEKGGRP
jgi:hypothetical protein